jgi:hypothetical protein
MSDIKGYNRRMSDKLDPPIPEMNGTLKTLVELIGTELDTPEQLARAIRESVKLQLHAYMLQKELLISMNALLEERKGIITRVIDKGLVPVLFMMVIAVLALLFKVSPIP